MRLILWDCTFIDESDTQLTSRIVDHNHQLMCIATVVDNYSIKKKPIDKYHNHSDSIDIK